MELRMILRFPQKKSHLLSKKLGIVVVCLNLASIVGLPMSHAFASVFNTFECEGYKNGVSYIANLSWMKPIPDRVRIFNFKISISKNGGTLATDRFHFGEKLYHTSMFVDGSTSYGLYVDTEGLIETQNDQAIKQIFDFKFVKSSQKLFIRSYSLKQWQEAKLKWRMAENSKSWSDGGSLFNYGLEFDCF